MHPLEQKISEWLTQKRLVGQEVLLGFSGGADSTALLMLLKQAGQKFRAVHFEHGIRGTESEKEAEWCRRFCAEKDIPFECHSLKVPVNCRKGEGIEEAARRLRLQQWSILTAEKNRPVLLAHHQDDCLENFFLRLGRGAGSAGLTGLREFRQMGPLRIYRPMLTFRRNELEDYLHSLGIHDWCCDSSNGDVAFRRNAVRHELLPLWRKIFHGDVNLARSMEVLASEAEYLESRAEQLLPGLDSPAAWREIPSALLPAVLRSWWRRETGAERPFSRNDFEGLKQAMEEFSGERKIFQFSGGIPAVISETGLSLQTPSRGIQERIWHWRRNPVLELPETGRSLRVFQQGEQVPEDCEWFSAAALEEAIIVRNWQKGDRIRPFGADFHKKLQDLWTETGIPRDQRSTVPVLLNGNEIIWVPGVRRAEFGRLSPGDPAVAFAYI